MAKNQNQYLISYNDLVRKLKDGPVMNNILLLISEKVLIDDIVRIAAAKFVGKNFNPVRNYIAFNAEERVMENVLNECSNISLFSEKKVIVLRNVKKLLKNEKIALMDYMGRNNPDTLLIMISYDDDADADKILLPDKKEDNGVKSEYRKTLSNGINIYALKEFSRQDIVNWIREKFDDYKISEDAIELLIQYSNYSLDEILSEIEKLKTYSYFTKEITPDSIRLCNGISKDFKEMDFIRAVLRRDKNSALKVYDQITLKKDVEIYLIYLLTSAFIVINKLFDPGVSKLRGFFLKKELKLWFPDQEMLLPYYKEFKDSINSEKMKFAFEYIYNTDKILKTSGGERKTAIASLINNICSL